MLLVERATRIHKQNEAKSIGTLISPKELTNFSLVMLTDLVLIKKRVYATSYRWKYLYVFHDQTTNEDIETIRLILIFDPDFE